MEYIGTVNVLGTPYQIMRKNVVEDTELEECDGYCDATTKTIIIADIRDRQHSVKDISTYVQGVIRHELVHAFLFESGLNCESWASNEEIVDWIAQQFPKLLQAFQTVKAV